LDIVHTKGGDYMGTLGSSIKVVCPICFTLITLRKERMGFTTTYIGYHCSTEFMLQVEERSYTDGRREKRSVGSGSKQN